jgi:hypothetical protein
LSELEHETDSLRRRLEDRDSAVPSVPRTTIDLLVEAAEANSSFGQTVRGTSGPASSVTTSQLDQGHPEDLGSNILTSNDVASNEVVAAVDSVTLPRSIEGTELGAETINELFVVYFRDYHEFMPIVQSPVLPNELFRQSVFLFWAVIGVACRSYTKDTSLLSTLTPKIENLSLLSLHSRFASLSTVKALLVVINWPFPKGSLSLDIEYPLSGGMLHMALQIGLHVPFLSQDFARVRLILTEEDITARAEVWAYCVILYQRWALIQSSLRRSKC